MLYIYIYIYIYIIFFVVVDTRQSITVFLHSAPMNAKFREVSHIGDTDKGFGPECVMCSYFECLMCSV